MHVVYVVSVVNGACAGVLPAYKFTAFQAVNVSVNLSSSERLQWQSPSIRTVHRDLYSI